MLGHLVRGPLHRWISKPFHNDEIENEQASIEGDSSRECRRVIPQKEGDICGFLWAYNTTRFVFPLSRIRVLSRERTAGVVKTAPL